jgi:hypothetical protein
VTVVSSTSAHAPVTTGTATGTVSWTDSTTSATATQTVSTSAPVLSIVTGLAPSLATVGYAVINPDGTTYSAFTTAGVLEDPTGSGNYRATVLVPTGYAEIRWSNNNAAPFYPDVVNTVTASTGGGPVNINLAQTGLTPRALDNIADADLTIGDAMVAAICAAAGKQAALVPGLSYTVKTPSTGTVIRTFTLNQNPNPTSRS